MSSNHWAFWGRIWQHLCWQDSFLKMCELMLHQGQVRINSWSVFSNHSVNTEPINWIKSPKKTLIYYMNDWYLILWRWHADSCWPTRRSPGRRGRAAPWTSPGRAGWAGGRLTSLPWSWHDIMTSSPWSWHTHDMTSFTRICSCSCHVMSMSFWVWHIMTRHYMKRFSW